MTQGISQKSVIDNSESVTISELRFEHRREALGIGTAQPRLSWLIETEIEGWRQSGYEIELLDLDGRRRDGTEQVASDQSVLVPWPFTPLQSRQRLGVRVRVWGSDGQSSPWSKLSLVEAGLLQPDDWTAQYITPDWSEDTSKPQPAPLFRRTFDVRTGVLAARFYVAALGVYEAELNGRTIGDHVMAPGWTSYNHRLRYQTFDVTSLLREGINALGATVAEGWFRGRLGFGSGRRNIYGERAALLAQLEISYADGTTDVIVSDENWRATTGPILKSEIYDGETYDARLERPGWSEAGYDDADWAGVRRLGRDLTGLVAPLGPPVRRIEEIAPIAITSSPSGITLVDFGQNLVGRVRLTVRGKAGQTITMRHAEVLENGELGTRPLRFAEATDRYTLRGGDEETWEPRFTFHGFRYVALEGWPGEVERENLRAVVCHSDMARTGWFECSDALVSRLHENVVWGMRGNFLDVPTDCPQRDERLGWTGDINVFSPSACFLYDCAGFLQSWLRDVAAEQKEHNGCVPVVVPNVLDENPPTAVWGDAAVIVPWVLYQRFGDTEILAQQWESIQSWVDLVAENAGERRLWDKGFQFGDWLDPAAPPDDPADARTSRYIVATACFARSSELLGKIADVLGRPADAQKYLTLAGEVRDAFAKQYVSPNGRLTSEATTAYALAIEYGLLPTPEQRRYAGQRLAALVRNAGYLISTGFVGTPLVCDALCSVGEYDAAYRLLLQRENPSWLYSVRMGATTVWERWDSMLPDGSINPGEMTSFNHYALGAIADWLHRTVAGLAPGAPGYRQLEIRPKPGGGLTYARARHTTPYGMAECGWTIDAGQFKLRIVVPPNSTARVTLPGDDAALIEVGSGIHHWSVAYQPPARPKQALSMESPIRDVIADPEAWAEVLAVILRHEPAFKGIDGMEEVPLSAMMPFRNKTPQIRAEVERAIARLKR